MQNSFHTAVLRCNFTLLFIVTRHLVIETDDDLLSGKTRISRPVSSSELRCVFNIELFDLLQPLFSLGNGIYRTDIGEQNTNLAGIR